MKNWLRYFVYLILGLTVAVFVPKFIPDERNMPIDELLSKRSTKDEEGITIIDWRLLQGLDWRTGVASIELQALFGKHIKIAGFMVPLEDYAEQVSEFILVPSPQACIHVPPPPPNQMIYVKMKKPVTIQWGYRAIWLDGTLNLIENQSPYGKVSFEVIGEGMKRFGSESTPMRPQH